MQIPRYIKVVLFALIGAIFLYFGYFTLLSPKQADLNFYKFLKKEPQIVLLQEGTPVECTTSEVIDYYYYSDPPVQAKNNKFGLYIYAEEERFFEIADDLVNSNGGDWGYVLIPYNIRDYDKDKWTRVFAQLTKHHLIPIIQLHDIRIDDYQRDSKRAAEFLNTLVWPTETRYISVYNEPNDAKFWLGRVDPGEYARVLDYTIDVFKKNSSNFFIMNGALNSSAPSNGTYMDPRTFISQMNSEVEGVFEKLDGWASHPYPQPNFSGSPEASGWWSIRSYEKELEYLKSIGVEKELPVFITETGWAHAEGEVYNPTFLTSKQIGEYFKIAYEDVWLKDDRVVAVTPFTVRYDPPFDHFSWVDKDNKPYPHYNVVKSMKKEAGNPPHLVKAQTLPPECTK